MFKRLICVFLLLALACKNTTIKTPANQSKSAQKSDKNNDEEEEHRAPPPAYGNKVVKNK